MRPPDQTTRPSGESDPPRRHPLAVFGHRVLRTTLRVFFKAYCRAEYEGRDNVPQQGPLIVAANHASWLDSAFLGAAIARPIHYIVADVYYRKWYFKWLMDLYGAIPVDRGKGVREPVRKALAVLREGRAFGIFPEGRMSRDGRPLPLEGGVALIAEESNAPILPVSIQGGFEIFARHHRWPRPRKLRVRIGAPINPDGLDRRELLSRLSAAIFEPDDDDAGL